ncbi:hypothetical protein BN136_1940 [Cronobacter universalis NCTC 9529]|nr:hypothetical protein BN136_1940 [Cronobacter universalis NCTC 9529]
MHTDFLADEKARRHQRRHGADDHQQVVERKGVHQLFPRGDCHADGEEDRVGHGGLEEFVDHLRAFQKARRNAVRQLDKDRDKQHANGCGQANQLMAEHTEHIEQHRQQRAGGNSGDVSLAAERGGQRLGLRFVAAIRHQFAFAGQVRIAFAKLVKATGDDNRGEAAEHHDRQHAAQRHALIHMQQRRVADGERDRPFTHAARHDRQDQEEEDLERLHAQRDADAHPHQHADDFAAQHREENTQKALDQRGAVHAHDAADDNAADVEIENVGGFIEFGGGFHDYIRQPAVIDQRGRNEGGANRRRAHFADHRQALAELAAGEAEEREGGDHHHDIARQLAAETVNGDKRAGKEKQRQWNNPDFPGIHDMPPLFFQGYLLRSGRGVGYNVRVIGCAHFY